MTPLVIGDWINEGGETSAGRRSDADSGEIFLCSGETDSELSSESQQEKEPHIWSVWSVLIPALYEEENRPRDYTARASARSRAARLTFRATDFSELIQNSIRCFSTCEITDKINTALWATMFRSVSVWGRWWISQVRESRSIQSIMRTVGFRGLYYIMPLKRQEWIYLCSEWDLDRIG